jgi:hypothetical protein
LRFRHRICNTAPHRAAGPLQHHPLGHSPNRQHGVMI